MIVKVEFNAHFAFTCMVAVLVAGMCCAIGTANYKAGLNTHWKFNCKAVVGPQVV